MPDTNDESEQSYVPPKELPWGCTPFDELSHEQLREQCCRLYAATESLTSTLAQFRLGNEQTLYWSSGSGGKAMEEGEQALVAARQGYESSTIYYAFFRYARDLLFQGRPGLRIGGDWDICDACGQMLSTLDETKPTGLPHLKVMGGFGTCKGVLRKLQWSDLKPLPAVGDETKSN